MNLVELLAFRNLLIVKSGSLDSMYFLNYTPMNFALALQGLRRKNLTDERA